MTPEAEAFRAALRAAVDVAKVLAVSERERRCDGRALQQAAHERDAAIEARDFAEKKLDEATSTYEAQRVRLIEHNNELLERARMAEGNLAMLKELGPAYLAGTIGWPQPEEMAAALDRANEQEARAISAELDLKECRADLAAAEKRTAELATAAEKALAEMTAMQASAAAKACAREAERDQALVRVEHAHAITRRQTAEIAVLGARLKVGEELAEEARDLLNNRACSCFVACPRCVVSWETVAEALSAWDAGKVEEPKPEHRGGRS